MNHRIMTSQWVATSIMREYVKASVSGSAPRVVEVSQAAGSFQPFFDMVRLSMSSIWEGPIVDPLAVVVDGSRLMDDPDVYRRDVIKPFVESILRERGDWGDKPATRTEQAWG